MQTPVVYQKTKNNTRTTLINYDPWRRLIARYALYAVRDYLRPSKILTRKERQSAAEFIHSQVGQELILELGIPQAKISATLANHPERSSDDPPA